MPTPTTTPKMQTPVTTTPAATTTTKPVSGCQVRALTEKLAYEIWEKNGRKHGQDICNWMEAEKLAKKQLGI